MTKQKKSHDAPSQRHSPGRHARKCTVCRHPDLEAIEDAFLHWQSPEDIATEFGIADHSSIYRHAHACRLFSRRNAQYRSSLDRIIEHTGSNIKVTGRDVVNAIRVAACLTRDGSWVEPVRRVIYTTETASPGSASQNPNSQPGRLDHDATL